MAGIFKNPVNKTVDNLVRHLAALTADDEDKRTKAIPKLSDDIAQIHKILYGEPDVDPDPAQIARCVPKLLQTDTDLFCKLTENMPLFEFEAKKQTAGILNFIIRRCSRYKADEYIKSKTDNNGHNVIIDCLLKGYHEQHLAQNVGSVLQEMAKRQELAPMLLNEIRITRPKESDDLLQNNEIKNDDNSQPNNTQQPPVTEMEERHVVDELFILVRKPSFDIASDAYKTLQLLLTHNKQIAKTVVPEYLSANYDRFFGKFNALIQSDNYVTQRQFLNLLSELLLDKNNFSLMLKYISQKENLKIAMTLLKNDSNAISHEAFHIFKVFVANPKKTRDIHIVLWKNKEKLITFLQNFLPEKAKEDEAFAEEKKIVIKHLEDLPIPEEFEQHRKRKQSRAKSAVGTQHMAPNGNKAQHSKSIPNVPPMDNENNDNDDGNNVNHNHGNDNNNNDDDDDDFLPASKGNSENKNDIKQNENNDNDNSNKDNENENGDANGNGDAPKEN